MEVFDALDRTVCLTRQSDIVELIAVAGTFRNKVPLETPHGRLQLGLFLAFGLVDFLLATVQHC